MLLLWPMEYNILLNVRYVKFLSWWIIMSVCTDEFYEQKTNITKERLNHDLSIQITWTLCMRVLKWKQPLAIMIRLLFRTHVNVFFLAHVCTMLVHSSNWELLVGLRRWLHIWKRWHVLMQTCESILPNEYFWKMNAALSKNNSNRYVHD